MPDLTLTELAGSLLARLATGREDGARASARADQPGLIVTGRPVPLTPVQAEFLRPGVERPEKFSTALWLRTPAGVDATALERALHGLGRRHDAFRLRFHRDGDSWQQEYGDPGLGGGVPAVWTSPGSASTEQLRACTSSSPRSCRATSTSAAARWCRPRGLTAAPATPACSSCVCTTWSATGCRCPSSSPDWSVPTAPGCAASGRSGRRVRSPSANGPAPSTTWPQTEAVRRDLPFWQAMGRDLPPDWTDPSSDRPTEVGRSCWDPRAELDPTTQRLFLERFPTARGQRRGVPRGVRPSLWAQHGTRRPVCPAGGPRPTALGRSPPFHDRRLVHQPALPRAASGSRRAVDDAPCSRAECSPPSAPCRTRARVTGS